MRPRAVLTMMLLCGMLAGCASPPPVNKSRSDTAVCGDFTLTISTEKSVYKASELKPGKLLDFQVSYTYTGDRPEIEVFHSNPISLVYILTSQGEPLVEKDVLDEGCTSVLHRSEPCTYTEDGSIEYDHLGAFEPGQYKAVAYINLTTNEKQKVACKTEIPFTIY